MFDFWNWMLSFFGNKDVDVDVDVDDVAPGMKKEGKHLHTPPPLLLTIHDDEFEDQSFYNLLDNRCQITRLPVLRNKSVLGSAYGWLVLLDFSDDDLKFGGCCLWNPASMEIIDLPNLGDPYLCTRCVMSNPPTDPDCFIVFNQFYCWNQIICRVSDGSVFQVNREELGYSIIAMASFQGLIYGITQLEGLEFTRREFVIVGVVGDKVETRPLLVDGGKHHWGLPQPYLPSWVNCNINYLIESPCGNELVLVSTMSYSLYQESGVHFRIFRVDVNRRVCQELENLDGRTIFIGYYGHGFCCYSESFGTKIKPNSIYYIDNKGMAMHIYDLDDRSTTTSLPHSVFDFDLNLSTSFWVDLPHDILDYSG